MSESEEDLLESISLYQSQIDKVDAALSSSPSETERKDLLSLKHNFLELLSLTRENLEALKNKTSDNQVHKPPGNGDPLDDEYALFKAELETLEHTSDSKDSTNENDVEIIDIQDEINELIGSKCQAPYTNKMSTVDYYNALVFSADVPDSAVDVADIEVKVMFINPTSAEMIPCPFYLEGKCKFSDKNCKYSHGYSVALNSLREYKEPDFKLIKPGCRVLVKPAGSQLWVPSKIDAILTDDTCSIRHEGIIKQISIGDILPLEYSSVSGDGSDLSENEDCDEVRSFGAVSYRDDLIEKSLSSSGGREKLGDWEKHTKGIGSKLMAKMGYIVGTGLGKEGEGRLEPVQATILPPGKSLDHCMNLREAAGGDKNLFSAEKVQRKLMIKMQKRSERMYKRQKEQEKHNVFNIINETLQSVPEKSRDTGSSRSYEKELASSTNRSLNVQKLKIEEEIQQMKRELYILNDKLALKKEGSLEHKALSSKLRKENEKMELLEQKNGKLAWEINIRETKKKMAF